MLGKWLYLMLVNILVHVIMIAYVPFTFFRCGLVWTGLAILALGLCSRG